MALATVASSQSEQQPDETLPPASVILPTAPAAKTDAAKPDAAAKPDTAKPGVAAKPDVPKAESTADYLAQCLRDWDAATHMTRQEWARTCRRVASNRVKFMGGQLGK